MYSELPRLPVHSEQAGADTIFSFALIPFSGCGSIA